MSTSPILRHSKLGEATCLPTVTSLSSISFTLEYYTQDPHVASAAVRSAVPQAQCACTLVELSGSWFSLLKSILHQRGSPISRTSFGVPEYYRTVYLKISQHLQISGPILSHFLVFESTILPFTDFWAVLSHSSM